jgi:peptide/nickel transport system ATP-binding protein
MLKLKEERELALLYVTHDLASARYVADEMLVMFAGQIVERGPTEEVLQNPLHPYTRLLLSSVPDPAEGLDLQRVERRPADHVVTAETVGCRFVARCPLAIERCHQDPPALLEARPHQSARCHVTAPEPWHASA